jgi:rod shape-determining protein MreC
LRDLLNSAKKIKNKFLVAQLLTFGTIDTNQQIIINKGKVDSVYVGQPIVDAYGLFGRIISVGKKASKVLEITDAKSAIPVVVARNGIRGVVAGTGQKNYLELINIPETVDIRKGDVLLTSDVGGEFPGGYMVGSVSAIKQIAGERFAKILVMPSSNMYSRNVILFWKK